MHLITYLSQALQTFQTISVVAVGSGGPKHHTSPYQTAQISGGNHKTIRQEKVARDRDRQKERQRTSKETDVFYSRLAAI